VFTYTADTVATSTSVGRDIIAGFNALQDSFDLNLNQTVTGIDAAVTTGNLSAGTFDAQLAHDLRAH
jgi:hypothetical protein